MSQQLLDVFTKFHYPGRSKFMTILQKLGIKESIKNIDEFLNKQSINQIFNENVPKSGHSVSFSYLDRVQIDIIDMSSFYNTNSHYYYILLIIDVFSRQLWAFALKSKNIDSVEDALETYFQNYIPHIITSDNESSFMSAKIQSLLKKHNIIHITCEPGDHKILGIIDRVCRSIKVNIHKYITENNTTKYLNHLTELINSYNDSPHRSITNLTPNEATQNENYQIIFDLNLEKSKHNKNKKTNVFKVDDTVRIRNRKKMYERAYDPKYSDVKIINDIKNDKALFTDGTSANFRRLKQITQPDEKIDKQLEINEVQEARKQHKVLKKVRSEGLDESNILIDKRRRLFSK